MFLSCAFRVNSYMTSITQLISYIPGDYIFSKVDMLYLHIDIQKYSFILICILHTLLCSFL